MFSAISRESARENVIEELPACVPDRAPGLVTYPLMETGWRLHNAHVGIQFFKLITRLLQII